MKKILITNEPNFKKGVKSYVIECDSQEQSLHTAPNFQKAKQFEDDSDELKDAFEFVSNSFKNADVTIIDC